MVELNQRKKVTYVQGVRKRGDKKGGVVGVCVESADKSLLKTTLPKEEEPEEGQFGLNQWKPEDWVPYKIMPFHIWNRVVLLIAHVCGIYGFYLPIMGLSPKPLERLLLLVFYGYLGGIGTTAGAHRLWTHKSYKANKPLEWILMLMQTSAAQYPVIKWCRDHRLHHKYTDTDADPHNSKRGFFFSHMGWVLTPEHPEVKKKEKTVPMDDLENNPILQFQARHYYKLLLLINWVVPMSILYFYFPQPLHQLVSVNFSWWILQLNLAACVNSVAHIWGSKPYDKKQSAVENKLLSLFTVGEAFHNYHHTFPYDYKASELPFYPFNISTAFIDFFAWVGWATELKSVDKSVIKNRAGRTGDGSYPRDDEGVKPALMDGKIPTSGDKEGWVMQHLQRVARVMG